MFICPHLCPHFLKDCFLTIINGKSLMTRLENELTKRVKTPVSPLNFQSGDKKTYTQFRNQPKNGINTPKSRILCSLHKNV